MSSPTSRSGARPRAPRATLALAGTFALLTGCSGTSSDPEDVAAGGPEPIHVTLARVVEEKVERTVSLAGTLEADARALVAAETDGRLLSFEADLGDAVAADQVLARLDSAATEARLREADAVLAQARAEESRAQELRERGVVSQQQVDDLVSQLTVAEARRDVLAISLAHSTIRAPFAGRIAERLADVGGFVRTGTPLFVLVAENPLRLRGEIPERYAADLAVGEPVRGRVAAFPDDLIEGRLTRISPAADPDRRTLAVEAQVPNPHGRLKPGFFVKGDIVTRDEPALLIPAEAIARLAGVERVWVIAADSTATTRQISTGDRLGSQVEVRSGLHAGEQVATSALSQLIEGMAVRVRQAKQPRPEAKRS